MPVIMWLYVDKYNAIECQFLPGKAPAYNITQFQISALMPQRIAV